MDEVKGAKQFVNTLSSLNVLPNLLGIMVLTQIGESPQMKRRVYDFIRAIINYWSVELYSSTDTVDINIWAKKVVECDTLE
jgi:hypothetical protein